MDYPKIPPTVNTTRKVKASHRKTNNERKFYPRPTKGRRVPLHLQEKVENESKKRINDKQIIKLDKCSYKYFISPVVITVKHDKNVKITLEPKKKRRYS